MRKRTRWAFLRVRGRATYGSLRERSDGRGTPNLSDRVPIKWVVFSGLVVMFVALVTYLSWGCGPVRWEDVDRDTWKGLIDEGWTERPEDDMAALYPPDC